ncbi:hypothetical protein BJ742DRAFT_548258 [Cladochytrium replicatum]|nr:hypothetical protein BJ742DRAFT_548258 [Cladochytrium replicatum]
MLASPSSQSLNSPSSSPRRASWCSPTRPQPQPPKSAHRATFMVSAAPPSYSHTLQTIPTWIPETTSNSPASLSPTTPKSAVKVFFSIPGSMAPVAHMGESLDDGCPPPADEYDITPPSDTADAFDSCDRESLRGDYSDEEWNSEEDDEYESDLVGSLESVPPRGRSRIAPHGRFLQIETKSSSSSCSGHHLEKSTLPIR